MSAAAAESRGDSQNPTLSVVLTAWAWVLGIWIGALLASSLLAALIGVPDDALEGDSSAATDGLAMGAASTLMCLPLFVVLYLYWRKPRPALDNDPARRKRLLYLVAIVLTAIFAIIWIIAVGATVPVVAIVWAIATPVALYVMRHRLVSVASIAPTATGVREPQSTGGTADSPMTPPTLPPPVAPPPVTSSIDPEPTSESELSSLISSGESQSLEFKSTARWNLHAARQDKKIEHVITKTVCGFLNADGGTLLIGVDDAGTAVGLAHDLATFGKAKQNRDHYELWLHQHLNSNLSVSVAGLVQIRFETVEGADVCIVEVSRSRQAIFAKPVEGGTGKPTEFWVRSGNATNQLLGDDMVHYQSHHWGWWKRG